MEDAMIRTEEKKPRNKRCMYIFIFVVVVIIAGVGAYFGTRDSSNDNVEGEATLIADQGDSPTAATPAPTPEPTPSPTRDPTSSRTRDPTPTPTPEPIASPTSRCSMLEAILVDHNPLHVDAKNWLCDTDTWVPPANDSDPDFLWKERYAMAVFYYLTNGNGWNYDDWLSSTSVCDWFMSDSLDHCGGSDSRVTEISFYNNSLSGSLPTEIGILLDLKFMLLDTNLQLSGTIPTEIGQLKELRTLYLADTSLSGTIPTEIGQLTELTYLNLARNDLTGQIPIELQTLPLSTCYLPRNCFDSDSVADFSSCDTTFNCKDEEF